MVIDDLSTGNYNPVPITPFDKDVAGQAPLERISGGSNGLWKLSVAEANTRASTE
jgi:hypothetical protein